MGTAMRRAPLLMVVLWILALAAWASADFFRSQASWFSWQAYTAGGLDVAAPIIACCAVVATYFAGREAGLTRAGSLSGGPPVRNPKAAGVCTCSRDPASCAAHWGGRGMAKP